MPRRTRDVGGAMSLEGDLLDDAALAFGQAGQQPRELVHRGVGIGGDGQRVGVVVDVEVIVEAAPAQMIDQLVARDGAQPRLERLRLVPGVALQMHGQQCLLNDILAVRRAASRRHKAAAHDGAQPQRDMAEQPPIGLVVALPCQAHQCGEIGRVGQRARSFTYSCAEAETLHADFSQRRSPAANKKSRARL